MCSSLGQPAQRPREPADRGRPEPAAEIDHQRTSRRHAEHILLGTALSRVRPARNHSRLVDRRPARQAAHALAGAGVDGGEPAIARRVHGAVDHRRGRCAQTKYVVAVARPAPPAVVSGVVLALRGRPAPVGAGGVPLRPGGRGHPRHRPASDLVAGNLRGAVSPAARRREAQSLVRNSVAITAWRERCS